MAHKLLPFVFVLSFMWLNLFSEILIFNNIVVSTNILVTFILELFISGAVSCVFCVIIFWLYRIVLNFSIYSLIVPSMAIKDNLKWYFIIRNVIMGALYLLCFYLPYIYNYLVIADIIITFVVFLLFAKRCAKLYADEVVSPFVFRALMMPLIIYEFAILIFDYMRWLI
ncbi:MAG: hypothetical protein IJT25_00410 [Clostridia bacterium]|nr:hypothetical protein [Clostridia bacterium]